MSKRNPKTLGVWGANGARVMGGPAYWRQALKWNRDAEAAGERRRVFCASLADVFEDWHGPVDNTDGEQLRRCECGFMGVCDNIDGFTEQGNEDGREIMRCPFCGVERSDMPWLTLDDVRANVFQMIDQTPWLDWLLLTKRPQNILKMWPTYSEKYGRTNPECDGRHADYRPNVWLITSVSDQPSYDFAAPHLWRCRDLAPVLGFSAEPLLEGFKIAHEYDGEKTRNWFGCWNWFIVGGESGGQRRDCGVEAIVDVVRQCQAAGVACFVKQDCANRSEQQGRIPPDVWAVKEFPRVEARV